MPATHHAIDVAAPPERCWRCFADLASWPSWFPFLKAVHAESAPFTVGSRLTLDLGMGTYPPMRIITTIEEVVVGERVRWVGRRLGVTGNHSYDFSTRAQGVTRVTSHEEFSGWLARLIPKPIFAKMDEEAHRSLQRFKTLVESGEE